MSIEIKLCFSLICVEAPCDFISVRTNLYFLSFALKRHVNLISFMTNLRFLGFARLAPSDFFISISFDFREKLTYMFLVSC